jgi:hypothetical protein
MASVDPEISPSFMEDLFFKLLEAELHVECASLVGDLLSSLKAPEHYD